MVPSIFIDLPVVNNQRQGTSSGSSNQDTQTAVMGVVPLLIFPHEGNINTFLYLGFDFLNPFPRSRVGTTSHRLFLQLRFDFQVHLEQFFA